MSKEIEKRALEVSDTVSKDLGVYVVDAAYVKNEDGDYSLCFYIDKEGGVGIDDCESFSRAIEKVLDDTDIINDKYVLEVSSPGADRVLKKEREFLYYIGREVDVKLYLSIDGAKEFTGILKDYKDSSVVIKSADKEIKFNLEQAVYIKLAFRF